MRSRAAALGGAGALVVLVAALVLLLSGGDGATKGAPPASAAAKLVPADALVYVHLSTDPDRAETRAAAKLAKAFPSWTALRDGIVTRLQAPGCDLATKALKSADEAALAIFDTGTGSRANSLVLVDTGNEHPGPSSAAAARSARPTSRRSWRSASPRAWRWPPSWRRPAGAVRSPRRQARRRCSPSCPPTVLLTAGCQLTAYAACWRRRAA